jgi:hypothetical protein
MSYRELYNIPFYCSSFYVHSALFHVFCGAEFVDVNKLSIFTFRTNHVLIINLTVISTFYMLSFCFEISAKCMYDMDLIED